MNYIELINQFWQCDIEHSFNGSETRLYFYLLHTCNSLRWKNPFTHSDAHLAAVSGMSVNTLKTARNRLKQAGLIEFTPGSQGRGQSHKALYKLSIFDTIPDTLSANSLTVFPRTSDSIYKHKLNEEGKSASASALPSPVLTADLPAANQAATPKPAARPKKPKAPANANAEQVAALPLPHPGAEFAELWATFRAGPKQKAKAVSAFELMLKKLAKYPEGFAVAMLEMAIQGDWSGVENGGTAKAFTEWQAAQASRPAPARPSNRSPAFLEADPALNHDFLAEQAAREQHELDRQQAEWRGAHAVAA
ncbi:hypothetical protein GO988_21635 [Hymenobacter sp. HMF4947]|uniref:Uncharacterized protein n=1 Tax=Hymenobacter ginkgonis TaxID=2682976 RepID=A0A7K1TKJ7_9BACT|nr:hypothetical protein [Hymenobacter ginkgonis]MVN78940.1 hypothetical protein [Hymenobacter ginkgonis]